MKNPEHDANKTSFLLELLSTIAKLPGNILENIDNFLKQQIKLAVIERQQREEERLQRRSHSDKE